MHTLRYVLPADFVRPVPAEPLSTLQDFPCNRRPGLCVWSVHRQFRSESSGTCHRPLWVAASWPARVKRLFSLRLFGLV